MKTVLSLLVLVIGSVAAADCPNNTCRSAVANLVVSIRHEYFPLLRDSIEHLTKQDIGKDIQCVSEINSNVSFKSSAITDGLLGKKTVLIDINEHYLPFDMRTAMMTLVLTFNQDDNGEKCRSVVEKKLGTEWRFDR